ncbi:tRNA pseudouridine(38-40) synthase TruA [Avibacterium paragallinarum]|uniref:tRNA pseudouridine(38-40) synthase TruA n=1 Tax=Avibacterium paragallinarum TaxID=728 RepID=UPI00102A23B3|nr:tRNA pseudouridine(38-40) synthase TruA [Avibacterium paragallinarum]RZN53980.1 tRNA pseudouridine(38-40) synthase TruA [Avibacterium paragallinarum]TID19842.1 tRNA pseudouridine synthase A [Avibacterium paragallinarum]
MKIALGIEYNGKNYFGWQKQEKVASVQECLEKAISFVANEECQIFCAGRTDSGVHATGQVVHFETNVVRAETAWSFGVNANLPDDIAVSWAKQVSDDFHARFSATARRYRYVIYNNKLRSAILPEGVTHYHQPLDHQLMHEAGQALLGENDFSSFRAAQCQSNTPWRNIHHLNVVRQGKYIIVDIQANAFVHHMVRNIVGSLMEVGAGRQPVEWISWLLAQRNRKLAAPTAKPEGLYLVQVHYPSSFEIPQNALGPLYLSDQLSDFNARILP